VVQVVETRAFAWCARQLVARTRDKLTNPAAVGSTSACG